VKLLLDEQISGKVAARLQRQGHDTIAATTDASLRGLSDPDLFFDPSRTKEAKALCARCPVQRQCAAANATIELVREQYAANAAKVGAHFMKRLHEMKADYPCIGDIRGLGLMIGVEMIEKDGSPARAMVDRLLHRAYQNGLLLLCCGVSTLRFMPPLCVTEAEVDEAILRAVNRRLELVAEIRRHKEATSVPFVQPDVEERNLQALAAKNPGPLSADGLRGLYREVLDLTKRELG